MAYNITIDCPTKRKAKPMIKFNKHNVTNGAAKARVTYHLDGRVDDRECVTIYDKDYGHALYDVFGDDDIYTNDTDTMTDYFCKGRIVLFANHTLYAAARERAEAVHADREKRWAEKCARKGWAV